MFFDTHTHLHLLSDRLYLPIDTLVKQSVSHQVQQLLTLSTHQAEFASLVQQVQPFECLYLGLGLHPLWIEQHKTKDLFILEKYLQNPPKHLVALGEIGLDKSSEKLLEQWQKQVHFFHQQLDLSEQFQLPVSLHSRKTHNEILQAIKVRKNKVKGVIHGFSGSVQQAKQFIDSGFFIGVGGVITYFRANKTRQAMAQLPLDCLLLETDSPDMPLNGRQGEINQPKNIRFVFEALCELKKIDQDKKDEVAKQLQQNAQRLFLTR